MNMAARVNGTLIQATLRKRPEGLPFLRRRERMLDFVEIEVYLDVADSEMESCFQEATGARTSGPEIRLAIG